jgi:hypothetical protein
MAADPGAPSALPYVAWSNCTIATIPMAKWELIFGSLQALKAHVQEYPGCQKLEAWVAIQDNGNVLVHSYSTWDTPEQLEAYLERCYTLERMLGDVGDVPAVEVKILEKVF